MSKNVNKLQSEVLLNLFKENDIVLLTETLFGDEECAGQATDLFN